MNSRTLRILAGALLSSLIFSGSSSSYAQAPKSPHAAPPAPPEKPAPACLAPAVWATLEGERIQTASPTAVLSAMAKKDIVLLGESHNDNDHHLWQLQALAGLHALRPDMAIGFEMFPRRVQPALDRWVAGELTEKQFLEQSDWDKVWSMPAELYIALFQFARINRIPMIALNVDTKLNKAIVDKGWDAVPESEREGVGRPAPPQDAYRDFLFEVYRQHADIRGKNAKKARKSDVAFRRFVEAQTTWDRAMAEALARKALPPQADRPLIVGIMGSGHVRFGHGVPFQLRDLGVKNIGTLLPLPADANCDEVRAGLADAVFTLPQQAMAQPEPPRLGVRLEQSEDGAQGVRIAEVTSGSLADRTGLKSGDRLLEVGGQAVTRLMPVIEAVRQQPAGSWLPMRVRRGDETLELLVKFPAKP
ncbi:MAG TPA: ChaN family lipoprotein [Noviherbaspirillum sp.]|nr:ChaN family lipoprotein [Noviherbaspirillum sp.]